MDGPLGRPLDRQPVARGHQRFEWTYLAGFVRPSSGQVIWFLADGLDAPMFGTILDAFAREVGAEPTKRVLIVLDGAGRHVAGTLDIPEGLTLEFLPPYSPELQPAEHLWPLTNEAIANTYFENLDALDHALADRCCGLADNLDRIRAAT